MKDIKNLKNFIDFFCIFFNKKRSLNVKVIDKTGVVQISDLMGYAKIYSFKNKKKFEIDLRYKNNNFEFFYEE